MEDTLGTLTLEPPDMLGSAAPPMRTQGAPVLSPWEPESQPDDGPALFNDLSRRADFVRSYPELDDVCERLGFGWEFTLAERFPSPLPILVELARAAQPPTPAHHPDWTSALVSELVSDLVDMHHRPLMREFERLGMLMEHLHEVHAERSFTTLATRFRRFRQTVRWHLRHEETVVFPRCIDLEDALRGYRPWNKSTVTSALRVMANGHATSARILATLIALAEKARDVRADPILGVIRDGLLAMQADLRVHAYGEADILLPAAIAAEEQLSARSHARHVRGVPHDHAPVQLIG
jgi:iron-sulfur cluster repair protein YtfE (RIC family)